VQAREQSSRNLFFFLLHGRQRRETYLDDVVYFAKNSAVNLYPGFEILPALKVVWRFCTNLHNIIALKFDSYTVLAGFLCTSCACGVHDGGKKLSTERALARSISGCTAFISSILRALTEF
jgi:hypothetical protein